MTNFARCPSCHQWNAFTTRLSALEVPRRYHYCAKAGCGAPFANPPVFENGEMPAEVPITKMATKAPMYYRCAQGHVNFEPLHRPGQALYNLGCGGPDCRAPLTRQWGFPAPDAGSPLFQAAVPDVSATLFTCYSDHLSYLSTWTKGEDYTNLSCGHENCFAPIAQHCLRSTRTNPLPRDIPRPREFELLQLMKQMRALDNTYHSQRKVFAGSAVVDMANPNFFSVLCKLSVHQFNATATVKLQWKNKVYAELTAPSFMVSGGHMNPYCYPVDPDTSQRRTQDVAYADIGTQLFQRTPDVVDMLLTVVLRVVRMRANTQNDIDSIAAINNVGASIAGNGARWNIMSLFGVLIGSAACETGRGVAGYINVVAAFQHLKHDARLIWNNWATEQTGGEQITPLNASRTAIGEVYSSDYSLTGREPKRNSMGFKGSQSLIGFYSGRPVNLSEEGRVHDKAYQNYLHRDTAMLAYWRGRRYPLLGEHHQMHEGESPEETFNRKVMHYLRILFA